MNSFIFETVSLSGAGCYVDQDGFELTKIYLTLPTKCWGAWHLHSAITLLFFNIMLGKSCVTVFYPYLTCTRFIIFQKFHFFQVSNKKEAKFLSRFLYRGCIKIVMSTIFVFLKGGEASVCISFVILARNIKVVTRV